MTTIGQRMAEIEASPGYVINSIIIKSQDRRGCAIKWLVMTDDVANRRERFFAFSENESGSIEDKTIIFEVDVVPAG